MNKEYDGVITKDYAAYSNLNSYGNNKSPVSIVAPVTASFLPEIFYHMRPHPLPQWMIPNKQGTNNSIHCNPYSCNSAASDKTCESNYSDMSNFQRLELMFPSLSESAISNSLLKSGGDLRLAMESLLNDYSSVYGYSGASGYSGQNIRYA